MTGLVIFCVTYALISFRRLGLLGVDRPAGALLGAVACVALGVLGPDDALGAIDVATLLLLLGMMGMGAFLGADGFFDRAGDAVAHWARTPVRLLGAIVWGSGVLAALITNDAVCVLGAPLVVRLVQRHRLPPLPYLLALATAANTGSAATLVGNPQNMLCAMLGGLGYREHLLLVGPVALAGLALNHVLIWAPFRRQLTGALATERPARVLTRRSAFMLLVIGWAAGLYMAGAHLAWTAAAGCAAMFLLVRTEPQEVWKRIDGSVLVFFAGLFIVVEGLVQSGAPAWLFAQIPLWQGDAPLAWVRLSGMFLIGSNVVSNVPFILVVREGMAGLPSAKLGWELLAMTSTFAGNLTLLGSVANIIVAEQARAVGGIGFWQYLRVGVPVALVTTAVGTLWLVLVGPILL